VPTYRETQRLLRRRVIVDAARRCFIQKTYAATTLTDIAREAGLRKRAVTARFATKEEVMRAVAEAMMSERLQAIEEAVRRRPVLPPEEFIRALSLVVGPRSQAPLRIQAWALFLNDPDLAEPLAAYSATLDELLTDHARAWLESIGRSPEEAASRAGAVATMMVVVLNGIVMQFAIDPTMSLGRFLDAARLVDFAPAAAGTERQPQRPTTRGC